jgi:class 3 adenylate cyclase
VQGPWATGQILNNLFGGVVACVEAWGGDVLKFAGDALVVCWPLALAPDEVSDAAAARAAAACALALLQLEVASPAHSPMAGEPPLSLHCALHCGALCDMFLGDGDAPGGRWEHMVAGAALSELAPLVAAAAPGECVASDAVWALLGPAATRGDAACAAGARLASVAGAERVRSAGDAAALPLDAAALAALACFLPPALADTLEAGPQSWMAELRHVAVLFILLPPCGAEDFALAHALVAEVHRCVQRYGGSCQQSLADDKGTVSLAVWGKPPASHADDPCRAVAAACELATTLRHVAASFGRSQDIISCGVTTGRAFCGNVGSVSRCEWSVVGDVVRARRGIRLLHCT